MVMEVVHEDNNMGGDGNNLQCNSHPYKNTSAPGGICALCLQEKLGKLVSSSFPVAVFPSSSSSSSPSFRSDSTTTTSSTNHNLASNPQTTASDCSYYTRRTMLPFVLTHKKKKKTNLGAAMGGSSGQPTTNSIVFKRSKSTATPGRLLDGEDCNSPYKRGFWSFLYLSSSSSSKHGSKRSEKQSKDLNFTPATPSTVVGSSSVSSVGGVIRSSREMRREDSIVVVDENGSPDEAAFDRKVSRSRSVGCGSRSFSGDFFERISNGFGDCTLRRVESQREGGKGKIQSSVHRNSERVRCGGIFSGFMITSSSSSSSLTNSFWVSSSSAEENNNHNNVGGSSSVKHLAHGRSKSWGWALASPMRAFSKPSSSKRENNAAGSNRKNVTPNLAAVPSLLAVSG